MGQHLAGRPCRLGRGIGTGCGLVRAQAGRQHLAIESLAQLSIQTFGIAPMPDHAMMIPGNHLHCQAKGQGEVRAKGQGEVRAKGQVLELIGNGSMSR